MEQRKRRWWLIAVIILLIIMSQEYTEMAKDIGLGEALIGFAFLVLVILGIRYWLQRSRR